MTNISGKIYQMWDNPTNPTERRFPKTVIEAVYGLSSYLQTQFGNLANIYMPIEGITETKNGQEFVYRKTPNTIKAKSLVLDRIKGKTLAWNQICTDGQAEKSFSNSEAIGLYNFGTNTVSGHKYLLRFDYSLLSVPSGANFRFWVRNQNWGITGNITTRGIAEGIFTSSVTGSGATLYLSAATTPEGGTVKNLIVVDLTLLYGSAIDGLTDAQILEKFESEYPGYHSYEPGKLISNDAESIETVGFNLWDEEWEEGFINIQTGVPEPNPSVRTKNFIPVLPNTNYYCKIGYSGVGVWMFFYDSNKNIIEYNVPGTQQAYNASEVSNKIFGTPSNAAYIKFYCTDGYGTTYNNDICINLSDSSFNGQYVPYKKSVDVLNLDNIKVYSPNIWDEEWEEGYINATTGQNDSSAGYIRSKNFIPFRYQTDYYFKCPSQMLLRFYDKDKNYITDWSANNEVRNVEDLPNLAYMRFTMVGTSYSNNITVNVSQAGINGRYFPHGIINITGGLKGAGNVYDEIVGTKLYRRVGRQNLGDLSWGKYGSSPHYYWHAENIPNMVNPSSQSTVVNLTCARYVPIAQSGWSSAGDKKIFREQNSSIGIVDILDTAYDSSSDTAFKSAMSGVMLDYELANVEVYDLAEPLVLTMKAGTTESRVSPNAYGLSAPFCADITYSANENNDSASSQYAAIAGRLMNTHKLWGQDFNGEQDITGPLDDVTRINNLLYLVNGNVGIGQSNPQYKLDVAGTFRATGAVTLGSTLSVAGEITASSNITTSGNINVNTDLTSAQFGLHLNEGGMAAYGFDVVYSADEKFRIKRRNNSTTGDEVITIVRASGNVGIGTSSPQFKLDVSGTFRATGNATLSGTLSVASTSTLTGRVGIGGAPDSTNALKVTGVAYTTTGIYSDGYVTAGAVNSSSDARLKDSITPVLNAMDTIMSLKPSEWIWNEKHHLNGQKGAGLVAQEVMGVLPFAVAKEGEYLSLNYNVFHAYEIAGLQDHEERIKALEAENAELRRRLGA